MNKAHRDRLAFMRICSGKFEARRRILPRAGGKKMRLSQPQQLMASEREIVDEAYAGDIIGVFDPGIFSIGDTICTPGKKFKFGGIRPSHPSISRASAQRLDEAQAVHQGHRDRLRRRARFRSSSCRTPVWRKSLSASSVRCN